MQFDMSPEAMRSAILRGLAEDRDAIVEESERNERVAADTSRWENERKMNAACAAWRRAMAEHYQQAISLIEAAPMPDTVRPAIDRATAILRARGFDVTAGLDSVAVASDGHPTYLVRGSEREHWTAERIADDIERIEQQGAIPMPAKDDA